MKSDELRKLVEKSKRGTVIEPTEEEIGETTIIVGGGSPILKKDEPSEKDPKEAPECEDQDES